MLTEHEIDVIVDRVIKKLDERSNTEFEKDQEIFKQAEEEAYGYCGQD